MSARRSSSARQVAGIGEHQGLGAGLRLGRAALDQVAGECEGPAGEADQRHAQLRAGQTHGLRQPRRVGGRLERAQPPQVAGGAHRRGDHGADAGTNVDVHTDRLERRHDVREQDRGIDAVTAHRLQRDLGGELRRVRDLQQRRALADGAILRQRTPRLAHEPDGACSTGSPRRARSSGAAKSPGSSSRPRSQASRSARHQP